MISNYFIIAWRSIVNHKLFSLINLAGLALSMSVCMMVMLRVVDNFGYDSFHPADDQTFRINSMITWNGNRVDLATTALPLKEQLQQERHIVQSATTLYPALRGNASDGAKRLWLTATFTDPAFFDVFGFTLKHGDKVSALAVPNSLILTASVSEKFFGKTNPLGRILTIENFGAFQITGVLNEPPGKSHLNFEALASISSVYALEKEGKLPKKLDDWNTFEDGYTYVRLDNGAATRDLQGLLERQAGVLNKNSRVTIAFEPQALSAITPGSKSLYHETSRGSSWSKLTVEIGIALVILVAATFNYTNLSIARALRRGKEVGIRKLAGAKRSQIFMQYVLEAVVLSVLALVIASLILSLVLEFKPFNDSYEMIPEANIGFLVLALFFAFALFTGILAGSVPAWILSAFSPAGVLRNIGVHRIMGHFSLRKGLMIFQFTLSLVVVIFLSAFYQQFSFIDSEKTDYYKEDIVVLPIGEQTDRLIVELNKMPAVEQIARTSDHFGKYTSGQVAVFKDRSDENYQQVDYYYGDAGLVNMMGLRLVAGENFSTLSVGKDLVLLNESACRLFGFASSEQAVGQRLYLTDSTTITVSGVLSDFHHRTAGHNVVPLLIRNGENGFRQMLIKVSAASASETMADLESAYKKVFPDFPFSGFWMNERIKEQNDQSATLSLLGFLAFMTVTIASMGLLGLVVYSVETRKKEISIRKIVGASVSQVVLLLSRSHLKLLSISGALALPIGWVASQFFLMGFPTKVSFGVGSLLLCFASVAAIGILVILPQTLSAAAQNPSANLKSE